MVDFEDYIGEYSCQFLAIFICQIQSWSYICSRFTLPL